MSDPLAYFITFTTYGTWLHGRAPGSVDRGHNIPATEFITPNPRREAAQRQSLRQEPYLLDEPRRAIVLRTIIEVCRHRSWKLWAAHVRSNHLHVLITANQRPEKVMSDLKAWASRRLREACGEQADRDRWTQHGSTRWINDEASFLRAAQYVVDEQGVEMASFLSDDLRKQFPEVFGKVPLPSLTLPARFQDRGDGGSRRRTALAGRLTDDLPDIIHEAPSAVPDLLRAIRGMTPDQLRELRDRAERMKEDDD